MKKRLLGLVLCLALLLPFAAPAARADETVFFTAMGESILPLRDETMPFLSGTALYIPAGIFTGAVRKALDVSCTGGISRGEVILYSGGHSLWFDLSKDYAVDGDDNLYTPGAIVKNGQVFVSSVLVARFFDLRYSVTEVDHGYMVWLRKQDYALSDVHFADAASYTMDSRYKEYQKIKAQQKEEQLPAPAEPQPEETVMDGKRIYLCLAAGANTTAMLDTLERSGTQGTVFFTPEEMGGSGGVLRRAAARGHSVGILADAGAETPVLEQLALANDALEAATCGRTRLVMVRNAGPEMKKTLTEAGFCVVTPNMDRTGYGLRTAEQAQALVRRISQRQGSVSLWLGDQVSVAGLRSFLTQTAQAEGRCRALTETG